MRERYRIFRKEIIGMLIALLVLQGLLYVREQSKSVQVSSIASGTIDYSRFEYNRMRDSLITGDISEDEGMRRRALYQLFEEYQNQFSDIEEVAIFSSYEETREQTSQEILTEFDRLLLLDPRFGEAKEYCLYTNIDNELILEREEVKQYSSRIAQIRKNADNMLALRMYADPSSYVYANIQKSISDYEVLEGVEQTLEANAGVESVLGFAYTPFLCLLCVLIIAVCLSEETKRGLLCIVYLAPGGRGRQACHRVVLLAISSIIIHIFFYGELVIQAAITYGHVDAWKTGLWNLKRYELLPIAVNKITFLCIIVILQMLASFAIGMLFMVIFRWLRSQTLAFSLFALIVGIEYLFYQFLGRTSLWSILRYLNLVWLLQPERAVGVYQNWGKGTFIVGTWVLYLVMVGLLLLLTIPVYIGVLSRRKPVTSGEYGIAFLNTLQKKWQKLITKLPLLWKEVYKLFVYQRGIFILLLVVFVTYSNRFEGKIQKWEGYEAEFYERFGGQTPGEEYDEYIYEKQEQVALLEHNIEELKEQYSRGEIGATEYSFIFGMQEKRAKLNGFLAEQNALRETYHTLEEKGIDVHIVDVRDLSLIFGDVYYNKSNNYALICLLGISFLCILLYSQEKQSGMEQLLYTVSGREKLRRRKIGIAIGFTSLIWGLVSGFEIYNLCHQFELEGLDVAIQQVPVMMGFGVIMTTKTAAVLYYLRRLLLMLFFLLPLSVVGSKASHRVSILIGLLFFVPHLVALCGIDAARAFSIVVGLGGTQMFGTLGNSFWLVDLFWCLGCLLVWLMAGFKTKVWQSKRR